MNILQPLTQHALSSVKEHRDALTSPHGSGCMPLSPARSLLDLPRCPCRMIGWAGNGLKTSSMRLGKDLLVFTKTKKQRGEVPQALLSAAWCLPACLPWNAIAPDSNLPPATPSAKGLKWLRVMQRREGADAKRGNAVPNLPGGARLLTKAAFAIAIIISKYSTFPGVGLCAT